MALNQQKIAVGHGNAAGFVKFTALSYPDAIEAPPVHVLGSYSKGEKILRGDRTVTFEGDDTCKLTFDRLTEAALKYLNDTYCAGLYWGRVTLSLNLLLAETYASYNATIILPQQSELSGKYDPVMNDYTGVEILVLNLEAI